MKDRKGAARHLGLLLLLLTPIDEILLLILIPLYVIVSLLFSYWVLRQVTGQLSHSVPVNR